MDSELSFAEPAQLGIDPTRWRYVDRLLRAWTESGEIPAAALAVGRHGQMLKPIFVGRQTLRPDSPSLRDDALFLVASISKPIAVGALMILVERGQIALDDRVRTYLPLFTGEGREDVSIRHLMTHTSGLPDMVANNEQFRRQHKPLAAFTESICREPLLFPPGTKLSYQSMGTALLAEILASVSGVPFRDFVAKEVFEPLKMFESSFGVRAGTAERIAEIRVSSEMEGKDWNWNSEYWRGFGIPGAG